MPMAEDLSEFFAEADFATTGTLDGEPVVGIFDRPHALAELGYVGGAATRPTYLMQAPASSDGLVGQALVLAGLGTWTVAEARPDGTGLITLELESA